MANTPILPPGVTPHGYIDPWETADPVMPRPPGREAFSVGGSSLYGGGAGPALGAGAGVGVGGASAVPVYDLPRYVMVQGSKVFSVGQISVSSLLDRAPTWRNFLHFRNASGAGGANIYINFGAVAVIDVAGMAGSSFRLAPDEQILFDAAVPQDDIYAIADAAGGLLACSFGVIALPMP